MRQTDVAVIGGGPAGCLAALTAAGRGLHVTLVEKNARIGRKLGITGKGRCNLTNCCEVSEAVQNIPHNGRFLFSALQAFPPRAVMEYFEALGVPLKVERGARVFPVSDRASDVVAALDRALRSAGCRRVRGAVERVERRPEGGFSLFCGEETLAARAVALATGGASYPGTGSTGDGYRLARALGHTVTPLRPSLVPLEIEGGECGELQGLSLRNTGLSLWLAGKNKPVYTDFGEMLFTHFGVSGPMVLSASAHMSRPPQEYTIALDLKPALSPEKLEQRLLRELEAASNKNFINLLPALLPQKLGPVVARRSKIPLERKCNAVTREERRRLAALLKDFRLRVSAFRPMEEAIVTAGGVSVREIQPKTMESKLVPGLYFAGELIDVDAYTGGFNLQIALCTGYAAGRAALKEEETA